MNARQPYPSDVSDDEWALVAPYLTLLPEDAGQREHALREVFNGLRYVLKTGAPWRWMPNDLPPWAAVYQQAQRWLAAGCFEALAEDLRAVLRVAAGRKAQPNAAILDSRTLRSSPESGARAGYDGAKRKRGLQATPSGRHAGPSAGPARHARQHRRSGRSRQTGPGRAIHHRPERQSGLCDQGYTGPKAADAAKAHGIELEVIKLSDAKRGFVLLPRRWVVERSFAWATRFRRLVKDYEGYASTLADLHLVAFACLMLKQVAQLNGGP